jgi:hypothetical protein
LRGFIFNPLNFNPLTLTFFIFKLINTFIEIIAF